MVLLPLIIVLTATNTGEWRGEWHGMTTAVSIFKLVLNSRLNIFFILLLIFTLFNPIYSKSSIIVLISLIVTYIFSYGFYGPRVAFLLSIIHSMSESIWLLISVLIIPILLIFISISYIKNIMKKFTLIVDDEHMHNL